MSKSVNIYTDIDSLLDTRFPTMAKLSLGNAAKASINGYQGAPYYHRLVDRTDYIDYDEYLAAYAKRDLTLLQIATPTKISQLLMELTASVSEESAKVGPVYNANIVLNLWPYKLSPDEEARLMGDLIPYMRLPNGVSLETVYVDPVLISPSWIKTHNVSTVISYEGDKILGHLFQDHNLAQNRMPNFSLLMPTLFKNSNDPIPTLLEKNAYGNSPFRHVELSFMEWLDIKFIPAYLFNGILYEPQPSEAS